MTETPIFCYSFTWEKKAGANRNSKEILNFKETLVKQVFKMKRQNTLLLHAITLTWKQQVHFSIFWTDATMVMAKVWLSYCTNAIWWGIRNDITWHARWFHITKHWKVQLQTILKKRRPFSTYVAGDWTNFLSVTVLHGLSLTNQNNSKSVLPQLEPTDK